MKTIYVLQDPRTQQVRYVGETANPQARLAVHCSSRSRTPVREWTRELARTGLRPVMLEIDQVAKGNHLECERWWIEYFRFLGTDLLNLRHNGYAPDMQTIKRITNRLFDKYRLRYLQLKGVKGRRLELGLSYQHIATESTTTICWAKNCDSDGFEVSLMRAYQLSQILRCDIDDIVSTRRPYWAS